MKTGHTYAISPGWNSFALTHGLAQDVHVLLHLSQNHVRGFSRKIRRFLGKANKSQQAKPQQSEKQVLIKKYSSENLSTGGVFDIEGYKQIVQVKASVKKKNLTIFAMLSKNCRVESMKGKI